MVKDDAKRCVFVKENGERCRSARRKSGYCYFHDPECQERLRAASRVGGLQNRRRDSIVYKTSNSGIRFVLPCESDMPREVARFLIDAMNAVAAGDMDPKVGNCLATMSQAAMKAISAYHVTSEELEERLCEATIRLPPSSPHRKRLFEAFRKDYAIVAEGQPS